MTMRHTRRIAIAAAPVAVLAGTAAALVGGASASADPSGTPPSSQSPSEAKIQAKANAPASGEIGVMGCSHNWSNKDADYGYVDADWLRYRTGPHNTCNALGQASDGTKIYYHCYVRNHNTCNALGQASDGTKIYYHCYVRNSAGNTWTHGRVAGTNRQGWFYDGYLSDNGSYDRC